MQEIKEKLAPAQVLWSLQIQSALPVMADNILYITSQ